MKNTTVKILSAVMCVVMLVGVAMLPVSAAKDTDIKNEYIKVLELTFDDYDEKTYLEEGENIIEGYTLVYEKHSKNGEAYINNGRLYIIGSSSDGVWFKDLNLDGKPYYINMKTMYTSATTELGWAGLAVHRNSDSAYVCGINSQQGIMRRVIYNSDGSAEIVSAKGDVMYGVDSKHEDYFWSQYFNWRVPINIPYTTELYSEVDGNDHKLYMAIKNPEGSQIAALNDYDYGDPSSPQRKGEIGLVLNDSGDKVGFAIDKITIKTRGYFISVDDKPFGVMGETPVSTFTPVDKQLVYALVDGDVKYSTDTIIPPSDSPTKADGEIKMSVVTKALALETGKVAAVDNTGLMWTLRVNKADLDALIADENISKIEVGALVVPKDALKGDFTREALKDYTDISSTVDYMDLDGDEYIYDAVYDVAKEDRDTEFSGIGYIKFTMNDGEVVELYSAYASRKHTVALSELVEFPVEDTEEVDTEEVDTEEVDTDKVDTEEVDTEEVDTDKVDTEEVDTNEADTDKVDTDEADTNEKTDDESETEAASGVESEAETGADDEVEEKGFFAKIFDSIINFIKNIIASIFGAKE